MPTTWRHSCSCCKRIPTTTARKSRTLTLTPKASTVTSLRNFMLLLFLLLPTQNALARLHSSSTSLHGLGSVGAGSIIGGSGGIGIGGGSGMGGSLSSKDAHGKFF